MFASDHLNNEVQTPKPEVKAISCAEFEERKETSTESVSEQQFKD
jgi:hypothetical protein